MLLSYHQLDHDRAQRLIDRLGVWLLVAGELTKGVYRYPTAEESLSRESKSSAGKSLRALIRTPEVLLHKAAGTFTAGAPLRVLCNPASPDFVLSEFEYHQGAMYRVTLTEAQTAPTDTAGRKWL